VAALGTDEACLAAHHHPLPSQLKHGQAHRSNAAEARHYKHGSKYAKRYARLRQSKRHSHSSIAQPGDQNNNKLNATAVDHPGVIGIASSQHYSRGLTPPTQDFSYLAYYAYAEVLPDKKPADTVLESLKGIPVGEPVEEIKRVSEAFELDFAFMRAVAKIESDFDPKQRTGSYIGLFQLSRDEFAKYGSGNITDSRDNAVAAAYKLVVETKLFELDTHKKATLSDIYLIHQQGMEGAAEHINHPERVAWESMCATDEGRERGEEWCKRAIWGNTLPNIKHIWKSVNNLTSGAFVAMWQQRVEQLYLRYSEATAEKKDP
jgi:hypothetical protein